MDHGGETARQTTLGSTELGTADAVQGNEANSIASGTFDVDGQLGAVAAPLGSFSEDFDLHHEHGPGVAYPNNGVSWRLLSPIGVVLVVVGPQLPDVAVFLGHLPGGGVAAYDGYGYYALQLRPGAGHGEVLGGLLLEGAGHGEVFVSLLPSGGGVAVHGDYGYYVYVSQHRPGAGRGHLLPNGAGHGEAFVGHLLGGGGAAYNDYGYYALQPRPGAGHGEVLVGLLLDGTGHGEVFLGQLPSGGGDMVVYIWYYALQPRPDARSVELLRGPNLGEGYDNRGVVAQHLRNLLPLAGIGASSVAINGLAAGPGSPAAAFHLFVLLLGGLFLVILHVLRA